jgi:hypothetical protein
MSGHEHDHTHDHDHGHDHDHDHDHGENGAGIELVPGFHDIVHWLSEQSCIALSEDGVHASIVFLGLPGGGVKAQVFDAKTQEEVAPTWGKIATWARGIGADSVYFIAEGQRGEDEDELEDVLVFAALHRDGHEVNLQTPFTRNEDGTATVGETKPSEIVALPFNEMREVWGLPLVTVEAEGEHDHSHDGHDHSH